MFNDIIGNDKVKEVLEKIVISKTNSHAYMFCGEEGIGKRIMAKEFAKGLLCDSKNSKPCNICKSCLEFENLNNPDFFEIESDGNSIKIEQIRKMNKSILEKPIVSPKKVYIINDSELMTKEAGNSLLKTLEEPPEYVCIILITSNENIFLNTIKSRCVKIKFNKLNESELRKVVQNTEEGKNISNNLIKLSEGSVKRFLELQDKEKIYSNINNKFKNLQDMNELDLLNLKDEIFNDKEDINNTLDYISTVFFNNLTESNSAIHRQKHIKCIEILEDTKRRLRKNSNFDMTIDRLLLKTYEALQE